MEDIYLCHLECQVPSISDICDELKRKGVVVSEANIRHAIKRSNIQCKDEHGNYTGSKRMLTTRLSNTCDLHTILKNIDIC